MLTQPRTPGRWGQALGKLLGPRLVSALIVMLAAGLPSLAWAAASADGLLIDRVWSGHPVGFALLTERGHQFIAYFDAERRLTVTGRKLGETNWTRVQPEGVMVPSRNRRSNVTGWDSHNYLTMTLDRDGCLHLCGNMHADPLVYYRTREPFDLATLERLDRMTGARESRATYPHFFRNGAGDLCFKYRDGGSGNGSDLYNIYQPETKSWRRLFDTPLLEGEGERNAYSSGPSTGPDGRFHLLWMWRETPDALSNNNLSYARSRDLIHWETSAGKPLALPITRATGEIIDAAKPGEGLINMCYALGFDQQKRPVAVYHRFDAAGHSQAFIARPGTNGPWQTRQLSDWKFHWDFAGGGSQLKQVSLGRPTPAADGSLLVDFSTREAGAGRWRIDGQTLAVLEQLPPTARETLPAGFRTPVSKFFGMDVKTVTSGTEGRRWILRWETLGPNRDLKPRDVPPPSELRLYELPETNHVGAQRSNPQAQAGPLAKSLPANAVNQNVKNENESK